MDPVAEKQSAPAESDDPFAVDQSTTASAIPVSRQQGPGKSLEVTCPMCETHGFVSPKAAGKLIKCCNPQCLVPIFTAPVIKKEVPVAPPPPPKKKIPWLYIGGALAAVAIAAVCIVVMNQTGTVELPPLVPPDNVVGGDRGAADGDLQREGKGNEAAAGGDGKKPPVDVEVSNNPGRQVAQNALQRLSDVSQKMPALNKSLYRRMAAMAFITAGDPNQANVHLDLLEKRGSTSPYEGVFPRAIRAWQNERAPADEFRKEVGRVKSLAEKLPRRGRLATEAALAAAPLLVAAGKSPEARQLLADHHREKGVEAVERLAAAMQVVIDDQTFDLDTTLPGRTIGDWQAPFESAVTLILAHHGHWDEALAWATQSEDAVKRAEQTILWAESYLRRAVPAADAAGFERAKKAADGLPGESQARLLARLADVKLAAGDRAAAEELIAHAQAHLARVSPAKPIRVEGVKPLLDLKLPDPIPYVQAALAASEIASVQAQLGESDAAWQNVLLSLRMLHGIAPSSAWRDEHVERFNKDPKRIGAELNKVLALKLDDEKRRALGQYSQKLTDVAEATSVRFFWQKAVLEAAARCGLLDQVWDELQVLDRKTSIHEREPLLSTALPLIVASRFAAAGNQKKAADISRAVEKRTNHDDPQVVQQISEDLFQAGDYTSCIERLTGAMNSSGALQEWTARLACRLVNAGKISETIAFSSGIHDAALRVDTMFLTAALAARTGHGPEFWKGIDHVGIVENAAACAGLVVGLKSLPESESAAADK
jgi:hypothetical protein